MTRAILDETVLQQLIDSMKGSEGHVIRVYMDGVGIPTIGYGYALIILNADKKWVVRSDIASDFRSAGIFTADQDLSAEDINLLQKAADLKNGITVLNEDGTSYVSPITTFSIANEREDFTKQESIHNSVGWSFSALRTVDQLKIIDENSQYSEAENLLRSLITKYEEEAVDELADEANTTNDVARERFNNLPHSTQLALIDLAFGGRGPIGPSLAAAINAETPNVIAAWYEIRFRTNATPDNIFVGINKRRAEQAEMIDMSGVSEQNIKDYLSDPNRKVVIEEYLARWRRVAGDDADIPTFDDILKQAKDQMIDDGGTADGSIPDPTESPQNPDEGDGTDDLIDYTVKSGDSLSRIAQNNNTTVDAILAANPGLTIDSVIQIGQLLKLPAASNDGSNPSFPSTYTALPGDTISSIADLFDLPDIELIDLNPQLTSFNNIAGISLNLPGASSPKSLHEYQLQHENGDWRTYFKALKLTLTDLPRRCETILQ